MTSSAVEMAERKFRVNVRHTRNILKEQIMKINSNKKKEDGSFLWLFGLF